METATNKQDNITSHIIINIAPPIKGNVYIYIYNNRRRTRRTKEGNVGDDGSRGMTERNKPGHDQPFYKNYVLERIKKMKDGVYIIWLPLLSLIVEIRQT